LLFKSFTGLSVQQFDDVFKEIESKYEKYEIKRLSYKRNRERAVGAGRQIQKYVIFISNANLVVLYQLDLVVFEIKVALLHN